MQIDRLVGEPAIEAVVAAEAGDDRYDARQPADEGRGSQLDVRLQLQRLTIGRVLLILGRHDFAQRRFEFAELGLPLAHIREGVETGIELLALGACQLAAHATNIVLHEIEQTGARIEIRSIASCRDAPEENLVDELWRATAHRKSRSTGSIPRTATSYFIRLPAQKLQGDTRHRGASAAAM